MATSIGGLRPKVLFIGGSLNQTSMLHAIGRELTGVDACYTPHYCDGYLEGLRRAGLLDRTVLAGPLRKLTEDYLASHGLPLDPRGERYDYDLIVTCSDLIVQKNIRGRPVVLVQEGMTDPENLLYPLVRRFGLPRWLASTATTGLSLAYDRFCVASDGYRDLFASRGVPAERITVTGIPNFDNCAAFLDNDFPHRGYVLVATSDTRETFKRDDREAFLRKAKAIAAGRPILFKLHPNENFTRSEREIRRLFPQAPIFRSGNTNHMIANCDVLVTQYSTVVYIGLALGKECHSAFDLDDLRRLVPLQNGGASAAAIAAECRSVLGETRIP
jgi:hypothetical protein